MEPGVMSTVDRPLESMDSNGLRWSVQEFLTSAHGPEHGFTHMGQSTGTSEADGSGMVGGEGFEPPTFSV